MTVMTSRPIPQAAPTSGDWRDQASCRYGDPELWFASDPFSEDEAKQICARCPVITQCLNAALESRQGFGVWGGLNRAERDALLKHRRTATMSEFDMDDWLEGRLKHLPTNDATFLAIARGVRRGLSFREIDRKRGSTTGTTVSFVSRMRRQWEQEGREVPEEVKKKTFKFTDEQVLHIREEYARGGVRTAELAKRYGVKRTSMDLLLNGDQYQHVGGPLRPKRSKVAPSYNSRVMWGGGQEGFLKNAI